jgi:hypothetical protein
MNDLFDTPAYKLVRRDDPATSHDAAEQLDVGKMERLVLSAIKAYGTQGCISDDVLNALYMHRYSSVTARYKALKEKNLVVVDNRKRKAESGRQQLVMWAKEFYTPEEA